MPAPKKKAPTAKRAQTKQVKPKVGLTSLRKKKSFQVWSAVLAVILVAAVGYGVVNYSKASSNYPPQCYALHTKAEPNTTNKCVSLDWISGDTGDLITLSDWPTYSGFTGSYTTGDQICVDILRQRAPRVVLEGSETPSNSKNNGASSPKYAPTPNDEVSVALTLKSNPATRKVLTVQKYGQLGSLAGSKCALLVGDGWDSTGPTSYDYRDAINTPGGIQVKVLQGHIKDLRVVVSHSGDRTGGPGPDVFHTESR